MLLRICDINEGVFRYEFRRQLLAACTITVIAFSHGISIGWVAPMLPKLQSSDNSPLDFVITIEQMSWIAANICVGAGIGIILYGFSIDYIGRKTATILLSVPHISMWILFYLAKSVEYLYVARICAGITGGGNYVVIPLFLSEIADNSIRGRLMSMFTLILNVGIFVGYILSSYVPYHIIPTSVAFLPILFLICMAFFPETPQHLIRCGHENKAEKSLKFYRSFDEKSTDRLIEFKAHFTELKEGTAAKKSGNELKLADFLTKKSIKAILICIFLLFEHSFTGTYALVNYMSNIFIETKSEFHADNNTIIIGFIQIIGTYISTILVDRFGRKILMISSTFGLCIGLSAFGLYVHLAQYTNVDLSAVSLWLPLCLMAFIIFAGNVGIISVTFVILVEVLPLKIRSIAMSICMILWTCFAFIVVKIYPIFWTAYGLPITLWTCAIISGIGLCFIIFVLEETKGISLNKPKSDEIV